jgi:hypothetical protein
LVSFVLGLEHKDGVLKTRLQSHKEVYFPGIYAEKDKITTYVCSKAKAVAIG